MRPLRLSSVLIGCLLWAHLLIAPTFASQATLVTPASPLSMAGLAAFLNSAFLSIGSCNAGNSAPSNGTGNAAFAGECWINTTSNPWVFNYTADGVHWSEFGTLNTSTFVFTPYSGTSPALISANNLSDVANAVTSLQDLGAYGNGFTSSGTATLGSAQVGRITGDTGAGQTFTLPAAASFGARIFIPEHQQGGTLTIAVSGTDRIYGPNMWGVSSLSMTALGDWVALLSDGSNWHVIAGSPYSIQALAVANNLSDVANAATAFANIVQPSTASALGGVKSLTCGSHQWFAALSTLGVFTCSQPAIGDISGWGTGVATALGVNTGSTGAVVLFNGAGGTPSSLTLTNATGLPFTGLPSGTSDTVLGYWGSTVISAIAVNNCANALTYSTSTHSFGCNSTAGTGTVTSVGLSSAYGLSLSGTNPVTSSGTIGAAVSLGTASNILGADVNLSSTSTFFTGPSMAQGTTGTWFASGNVTLNDTAGAATIACELWDGTSTIASGYTTVQSATTFMTMHLAGTITSPAGNIRISCKDITSTSGHIKANASGVGLDSGIWGVRLN